MKPYHLYGANQQAQSGNSTYIRRARVSKAYVRDNLLFAEIVCVFTGNIYRDVQIANYYYTDGSISNFGLEVGQIVLYIITNDTKKPIILGGLPAAAFEGYKENLSVTSGENHPANQIDITDLHQQNKSNYMNISKDKGITVKADVIRLQIEDILRVASETDGVIDNPLNGQNFINVLFPYLQALETKILAIQALSVANAAANTATAATAAVLAGNTSTLVTPPQATAQANAASASTSAASAAAGLSGAAGAVLPTTAQLTQQASEANTVLNQKMALPR